MEKYEEKQIPKVSVTGTDVLSKLVFNEEGILFFKNNSKIIINKSKIIPSIDVESKEYLCDYDKKYVEIYKNLHGYGAQAFKFVKQENGVQKQFQSLLYNDRSEKETITLTRNEIKKIFNPKKYDDFIIFNIMPNFEYVYSKKDGVIGKSRDYIIPSRKQIVDIDFSEQKSKKRMASIFGNEDYKKPKKRKYDDIDDLYIYSAAVFHSDPGHILITIKDGTIATMYFNIKYVGNDNFELTYSKILTTGLEADIGNYKYDEDIKIYYK